MTDEQRVKEVYPEACAQMWGGFYWINNGESMAIKATLSGEFESETEAWADAVSRLPKAEADALESAAPPALKDAIYAMIAEVIPSPLAVSETAVAQLWQTFMVVSSLAGCETPQEFYDRRGWHCTRAYCWLEFAAAYAQYVIDAAKASSLAVAGGESQNGYMKAFNDGVEAAVVAFEYMWQDWIGAAAYMRKEKKPLIKDVRED